MSDQLPDLRATDADRERVAERLRGAAADGQLSFDELDERLDAVHAARTGRELAALTTDLQETGAVSAPVDGRGVTVRRGPGGARWLVAIMGGGDRKGRWRLAERATSINVMGGADLDLTHAELAAEHVELTVFSLMGGADIRVPENLEVEVSELAFMGGNSVRLGDAPPRPGGPVLRLRLISIMGGTEVRRGPKPPRAGHHLRRG
ncbi:MAG TPA: DUF1707 domain-containing protein [Solirubrobacteraceae bacterium]|nr:DUF1707 domain-containing protein [Solirubrobacteraceae bacterium]